MAQHPTQTDLTSAAGQADSTRVVDSASPRLLSLRLHIVSKLLQHTALQGAGSRQASINERCTFGVLPALSPNAWQHKKQQLMLSSDLTPPTHTPSLGLLCTSPAAAAGLYQPQLQNKDACEHCVQRCRCAPQQHCASKGASWQQTQRLQRRHTCNARWVQQRSVLRQLRRQQASRRAGHVVCRVCDGTKAGPVPKPCLTPPLQSPQLLHNCG